MVKQRGRAEIWIFIAGLFFLVELVSVLTPPFQSPDEPEHVKRAYLLGDGTFLVRERRIETGGMIDKGLLDYMSCFSAIPFDHTKKGGDNISSDCKYINFAGTGRFSGLANTAMYFPLIYLPQALALFFGEHLGLHVAEAYYFARILSLSATLGILWWAFLLYPPPPACMALLVMPMSVFQLASASLDSVTFALSALVAALFLRGMDRDQRFDTPMHAALAGAILLLATSRIVYVSLLILLIAIAWRRRSWWFVASSLVVATLSLCWIIFVLENVHELNAHVWGGSGMSSTAIAEFYLRSPLGLIALFWRTFSDSDLLVWHWRSFVGILGWLDTPLDSYVYVTIAILLLSLAIVSVAQGELPCGRASSISLAVVSLASVFLIFLLALVGWTPHPAKVIEVQGRYFYPAGILLAYAIAPRLGTVERKLSMCAVVLIAIVSIADVVPKLLCRYG